MVIAAGNRQSMNVTDSIHEKLQTKPSAVLLDADNTLFAYDLPHAAASAAVEDRVLGDFGIPPAEFRKALKLARATLKNRLGPVASSHNRLLYFQNTLELLGYKSQIAVCVILEQTYWRTFLLNAQLFPGARDFLDSLRSAKITTCLITDLTAQIQFRKLIYFNLDGSFDYVITSEEAGRDKPGAEPFRCACEKLQISDKETIWMIGDNPNSDILGAQNVIEACMNNNVKKVIALSTDKAASPVNLYGATKLTSDKLFVAANYYKGKKDIKFSVVRYGNVMGSRGSVIPLFLSKKNKKYIPITDKHMTRFNITLSESVKFVTSCFDKMWGGELFVPKLPSYKITDLLKAISPNSKPTIIGIRPGEKLHEEMIVQADSRNTIEFNNYFVIMPNSIHIDWDQKKFIIKSNKYSGTRVKEGFSYNSQSNPEFLSVKKIINLIKSNKNSFHLY